jgi:hypothetical protein
MQVAYFFSGDVAQFKQYTCESVRDVFRRFDFSIFAPQFGPVAQLDRATAF